MSEITREVSRGVAFLLALAGWIYFMLALAVEVGK
jgi:hypothetical protein